MAKPRDLGAFALKAKATAGLIYSWQVPKQQLGSLGGTKLSWYNALNCHCHFSKLYSAWFIDILIQYDFQKFSFFLRKLENFS
ncbi:hypothetical protein [Nostoc sp.]|uniref:hypothetical protein n=1 Tax=Nostoc sp. TaxID=1180 RepID=UPI002FFCF27F